ncbi:DUF2312 domain-containing protein [Bradyrhizobium sp. USDA 4452]
MSEIRTKGAREALKSFVERIESLAEQIADLKDDQKAVFAEAKADGFDPKSIRRIIKRRQKDPAEIAENEAIDGTYMHAIGMQAESPLHVQVGRLVRDGMSREQVIETFQLLVPVNGEVIASIGGEAVRIWRTEDGEAFAEPYVRPTAAPERPSRDLESDAIEETHDRDADRIRAAADRAERRRRTH